MLSYQFLAFKELNIQTKLCKLKFLNFLTKPYDPLLNIDFHT